MMKTSRSSVRPGKRYTYIKRTWILYLMLLLPMAFFIIFRYVPMTNIAIAFKDYNMFKGPWASPWVGLKWFKQAFAYRDFWFAIRNTFILNILDLAVGFPAPIILAILLNEIAFKRYKRITQTIVYLPYFLSWIIIVSMAKELLGPRTGVVKEEPQLNNLMAASSAPDVCLTYSTSLISNYRDLGGLVDLAPYIDSLLPDLKAFLGPDLSVPGRDMIVRDLIPETGAVYSIPARRMNPAGANTFIRKDWLDKLGLPLPTTTQEFYDALVAFRDNAETLLGDNAAQMLPFSMTSDVRWRAGNLIESFIDFSISERDYWVNTVVDRHFLLPGYKEGVRFMNKMFNEGLIDPEFPLYTDDVTCDNLIKSGVVGAFIHNWDQAYRDTPGLLRDLMVNVPDAEIVTCDPFKNSDGETRKMIYDAAGVRFIVPTFSKNVEGALRYVNWLSKVENRSYLQIGEEGINHELVDGVPALKSAEGAMIQNSGQNIDYTIMINGLDLGSDELNIKAIANGYSVAPELVQKAYEDAMRNGVPDPVIPVALSAAGPVTQTLTDKGKTMLAEAITCSPEEFDAVWDAQIADWLASGAQAVIDERAVKYDEFKAQ